MNINNQIHVQSSTSMFLGPLLDIYKAINIVTAIINFHIHSTFKNQTVQNLFNNSLHHLLIKEHDKEAYITVIQSKEINISLVNISGAKYILWLSQIVAFSGATTSLAAIAEKSAIP